MITAIEPDPAVHRSYGTTVFRLPRRSAVQAALIVVACGISSSAAALEFHCIEASKYKHLYEIFGNDRGKFAQFFQLGERNLPDGELCRAALATGAIETAAKSKELGRPADGDKLLDMITQNNGWLATLYLASPGGNIGMGLALAQMARLFWLKTEAPNARTFGYRPDFVAAPVASSPPEPVLDILPELSAGWQAYTRAVTAIAPLSPALGSGRCASACSYLHVAGIDRHGTVFLHRGRPAVPGEKGKEDDRSMSQILEDLHRAEARVIALYRSMDAGEAFVQLFQATPTATVTPAVTDRLPRYISDLLRAKCGADVAQLTERVTKLRAVIADAAGKSAGADAADGLRAELRSMSARRAKVEQCVAAAHEKERLAQYAKFCPNGCDRALVLTAIRDKLNQLVPAAPRPGVAPPR